MIEKDRETIARQSAAEALDSDIQSERLTTTQKQERLHAYLQSWTHAVTYSGVAKDGHASRSTMETIILPKSKMVMGLSREYFGKRLEQVQRDCIQVEYRFSDWTGGRKKSIR